jgi:hypothetical protein
LGVKPLRLICGSSNPKNIATLAMISAMVRIGNRRVGMLSRSGSTGEG